MNATIIFPLESVLFQAGLIQTALAACHMRLFKAGLTCSFQTQLSDLVAAECDYDGYPAGGVVGNWSNPTLGPGQSGVTNSPTAQFSVASGGPGSWNVVGGFFIVTAGGKLFLCGNFPEPIPMQTVGAGFPLVAGWGIGSG